MLALLFHIAMVVGFVWGPRLCSPKLDAPIPYTVRLFEPKIVQKKEVAKASSPKPPAKKVKEIREEKPLVKKKPVQKMPHAKSNARTVAKRKRQQSEAKNKKPISLASQKNKKRLVKKKKDVTKKSKSQQHRSDRITERKVQQKIKEIQRRLKEKKEEEYLKKRLQELAQRTDGQRSGRTGTSMANGAQNKQAVIYGNFVKAKIWRNWHFPRSLADRKGVYSVVTIVINKDGRILDMKVRKYSGLAAFDRSVIKAIRDSDPLPPLPPSLGQGPEEIDIKFDLSKAGN